MLTNARNYVRQINFHTSVTLLNDLHYHKQFWSLVDVLKIKKKNLCQTLLPNYTVQKIQSEIYQLFILSFNCNFSFCRIPVHFKTCMGVDFYQLSITKNFYKHIASQQKIVHVNKMLNVLYIRFFNLKNFSLMP